MRIGILTSKTAEPLVRGTLEGVREVETLVVPLPVPVISILSTKSIASLLRARPDIVRALAKTDIVIIPGSVAGDAAEIAAVLSKPTFKGPKFLGELPAALSLVARGAQLDTLKSADEVLGSLRPSLSFEEAFRVSDLPIPRRGPPVLLFSEVAPDVPRDSVKALSRRLALDGADVIVVGSKPSWEHGELASRIRDALLVGRPVFAEVSTLGMIDEALSAGAQGVCLPAEQALEAKELLGGVAAVVSSRDLDMAARLERELGTARVIVDPVLDVPPLGLTESIARYLEASRRLSSPILFSAADVTEDVEADTAGMHGLLALIAVEVRASAYLVVEETYKSYRGTAEAKEAIRLAEQAWGARSTERGMFSRLLILKQSTPPPPSQLAHLGEVYNVGYVEPKITPEQYIVLSINYESGEIVATFVKDGKTVGSVAGRHAMSVARAAVRRFGLDPEHSAYLGYEIAKAELALRLGRTYTQDEQVIVTPWDRNGNGLTVNSSHATDLKG